MGRNLKNGNRKPIKLNKEVNLDLAIESHIPKLPCFVKLVDLAKIREFKILILQLISEASVLIQLVLFLSMLKNLILYMQIADFNYNSYN